MNNYTRGHISEKIARFWLLLKGYRLVAYNYVTGRGTTAGEIDLIVRRGTTLVFVEVKQRRTLDKAAYSVFPQQRMRIRRAAENFIAKNPQYYGYDMRFDVFLVQPPFTFRHLQNTF